MAAENELDEVNRLLPTKDDEMVNDEQTSATAKGMIRPSTSASYKTFVNRRNAYEKTMGTGEVTKYTIEEDRDEKLICIGYQRSLLRLILVYFLGVITAGFFLLVVYYWKPDWGLKLTHSRSSMQKADSILIEDCFQRFHVVRVIREQVGEVVEKEILQDVMKQDVLMNDTFMYFRFHKIKFFWNPQEKCFFKLRGLEKQTTSDEIYKRANLGMDVRETAQRRALYGVNKIVVRVKPILLLLIQEILNPFYIFQIFSVTVWIVDDYLYYSFCIIILSTLSISISLYTTRTQATTLKSMVKSNVTVQVLRPNGEIETVWEDQLVPGDVIIIPSCGCTMTCDAVLVAGNCIVNESSLTGESVPITKTPLPCPESGELEYSMDQHKRHTLFCGTNIIQTRFYADEHVKAVVVLTGFSTAKGIMVRSILYPMPTEIKLFRDALLFVAILAGFAIIGFVYTVVVLALDGTQTRDIVLKSLDIITIAVPPALPASLTIGMVYAQFRLKRRGIFCISPQRINLCGTLDIVCFDKTGTLTEDGLDMLGVQETSNGGFCPLVTDVKSLPVGPFVSTMATCHSLTYINEEIAGDPLDAKMFEATGWSLEESNPAETSNYDAMVPTIVRSPGKHADLKAGGDNNAEDLGEIGIIKQFPFSSSLQRMSVITRAMNAKHMCVYTKGAPEKIASLCSSDSIPNNFEDTLSSYTADGLRVIALAWKPLDPSLQWHKAQKIQRDAVESDLHFLGLMILQNKLKPETIPALQELHQAKIRTIMITGDNILTAINVARKCEIIQPGKRVVHVEAVPPLNGDKLDVQYQTVEFHKETEELNTKEPVGTNEIAIDMMNQNGTTFAMDGKTFGLIREMQPELMDRLAVHAQVFARMSPDQKMQLIEILQKLEYHVGMCGDGANDCGALKLAHAGIALSEAEASVAAPFTSNVHDISCIPAVMKEGRAALTTSFGMFKFMALYSMIQFTTATILLWGSGYIGDLQFLYIDIILSTVVILLMGRNQAYPVLSEVPPPPQLMTVTIIFSMVSNVIVQIILQAVLYVIVQKEPWYTAPEYDDDGVYVLSFENTVIFMLSCFLYINSAVAFSPGAPYRKELYTNWPYCAALLILYGMNLFLLYGPPEKLREEFEIMDIPDYGFKTIILAFGVLHFAMAEIIELFLVPWNALMSFLSCRCLRQKTLNTFQRLEMEEVNQLS
ncbi:probable cation-transporting ATPase 13A3 isoform X2 [Lytechinus variegatus]|uniref:probable cation-transporting ATPase 13A3 isoform X2 n=1 Tax=Lytechinus variegatus TaxID=7654 RepID=UPI001BB21E5B|nr:probable cation-transporting ATPase 13A3 isoform X2 [Lytechinus variegatus]